MTPKFPECLDCKFFIAAKKRHVNPICHECGNGEFFEERIRSRTPSDDDLMKMFGRMYDDS